MRLGSDSEFFAVDSDGKFKSVIGKLGGSKHKPRPIGSEEGYFIQEDNVAAEFNIPPCASSSQFVYAMSKGLEYSKLELASKTGWFPSLTPFAIFDKVELEHPKANQFGCNPFINAWTFEESQLSSETLQNPASRFAAGHVHISWEKPDADPFQRIVMAKALDVWLAIPFILTYSDEELVLEKQRRELYGKAGSIRPKSYGLEYIVLSNQWLKSPERMAAVWYGCQKALQNSLPNHEDSYNTNTRHIQQAINTCDKNLAKNILEYYLGASTKTYLQNMFSVTPTAIQKKQKA